MHLHTVHAALSAQRRYESCLPQYAPAAGVAYRHWVATAVHGQHTVLAMLCSFLQVVKRLLQPAAKIPTNNWECFMANLSSGDAKGCWYVVNKKVALYTAPVVALAVAVHLSTGGSLLKAVAGTCLLHSTFAITQIDNVGVHNTAVISAQILRLNSSVGA